MIGVVFGPLEVARGGRGVAPTGTSNFHDNHKCTTFNLFLPLRVYFFESSILPPTSKVAPKVVHFYKKRTKLSADLLQKCTKSSATHFR